MVAAAAVGIVIADAVCSKSVAAIGRGIADVPPIALAPIRIPAVTPLAPILSGLVRVYPTRYSCRSASTGFIPAARKAG